MDLWMLIDGLRARGVRRFVGPVGGPDGVTHVELEFGPPEPTAPKERPAHITAEDLREQVWRQKLTDEWAHVGGAPPWILNQQPEEKVVPDQGEAE